MVKSVIKMLKSIVECKVPSKFIIIEGMFRDNADICGTDVFVAFLTYFCRNETGEDVHLMCFENTPDFYLGQIKKRKNVFAYNFFEDFWHWRKKSTSDVKIFNSNTKFIEAIILMDSLNCLVAQLGFCDTYKILTSLKGMAKKVVLMIHEDLFSLSKIENLHFISSAYVKLKSFDSRSTNEKNNRKVAEVLYKKPGGKVSTHTEIILIDTESTLGIVEDYVLKESSLKKNSVNAMENLTTFELGLKIKDNERQAKENLILPYLKNNHESSEGEIIYKMEAVDLEDDPDDDLNI